MDEPWRWSSRFNLIVLDSPFFSIYMTSRTKLLTGPSSDVLLRRCDRDISRQLHTPRLGTFNNLVDDRFYLGRSEEHTSELQSLMRISSAVFCLKNKTKRQHTNHPTHNTNLT